MNIVWCLEFNKIMKSVALPGFFLLLTAFVLKTVWGTSLLVLRGGRIRL
ncbi:hypothetical protein NMYAN_60101 [Nitrosomonas nitrosa]|uniref:Uncharacterized protein n=1 Tax=Nitrosomonas nitrosa TaxID=52442 RepID=A0A8H8Z1L0_9PROT|nr:hypothetical protein NMYAN_60101 [Nitrosomonas nitrosa]